jgi:adenylate kinase
VKRRIVLLGPPASGKGTQAELIQQHFGIPATSTGAILRAEAKTGTKLGLEAHRIISKGGLAPDDLVLQLVAAWLDAGRDAFLFDGFPRTVPQAEYFDRLLEKRGTPLELAIFLEVSEATIRQRMLGRLTCSACGKVVSIGRHIRSEFDPCPNCGGRLERRADDNHEALNRRLEEYRQKSAPVADFYARARILSTVDADREVNRVFADISALITK